MLVSDLQKDSQDFAGNPVLEIYAKVTPLYCVYRTERRILVHLADDDAVRAQQVKDLAALEPLRMNAEVEFDGWHGSLWFSKRRSRVADRVRGMHRRMAQALVMTLGGDVEGGRAVLKAVQEELRDDRMSAGRLEYFAMAAATSGLAFLLFLGLTRAMDAAPDSFLGSGTLAMAVGMASLGAMFSISMAVKDRSILTDRMRRDNLLDAGLRIAIACVSAVVLFAMINGNIVSLSFGTTKLGTDWVNDRWAPLVVAFLAGFSERLVSAFLGKTAAELGQSGDTKTPPAMRAAEDRQAAAKSETAKAKTEVAPAPAVAADILDDEEVVDACLCDHEVAEADHTDDLDLPSATGGVEGEKV